MKPKYPVYIPSKNRAEVCYTANFFIKDDIDFKIVVEPDQVRHYEPIYGKELILVLPENNMKLLGSRLWIREHSIKNGFNRHWQFDDNIRGMYYRVRNRRIPCNANIALKICEDFTDRYTNIGISGFNYEMFAPDNKILPPFYLNCHVYSASLINNGIPYKWRLFYNDDTDFCLQVLTNGFCTVAFNCFLTKKIRTMTVKGGNTEDLYQDDGRLKMARALEAMWPEYVQTKWRFGRPQHVVNWKKHFKHPLIRRTDIDWNEIKKTKYDIKLTKVCDIKSKELEKFYEQNK